MTIVPETRAGKIEFYRTHLMNWAEDPESIGLTVEAVDAVQQLWDEAQAAMRAHLEAQTAARAATLRFHNTVKRLHAGGDGVAGGATLIQNIKSFAQITSDPGVYARASLPMPASPGRPGSSPAPGTPYAFRIKLQQVGEVEVRWKCDNPAGTAGTIYRVRRQLDDGPFQLLAMVGEKKLRDRKIPPGTKQCTYAVMAMRSTSKGDEAQYTFQFGNAHPLPEMHVKSRRLVA